MRRFILALAGLVVLALVAYSVVWFQLSASLRRGIEPWVAARRAEGYDLRWQKDAVEGFPFAFRLRFDGVTLAATRPTPFEATAAEITATAAPWDLRHWHLVMAQGASLQRPDKLADFTVARIEGDATAESDSGSGADLTATGITSDGLLRGLAIARAHAHVALPPHPPENHREPQLAASLDLVQITLPWAPPPMARQLDRIALTATIDGRIPAGPLPQALAAWRDDGGTLDVSPAQLVWGATAATLDGTLALDQDLQPEGALTATISGQNSIVDAVVAAGGLQPRYAGLTKNLLGLMAKPVGPDGEKALQVPLTIENGILTLGPLKLAVLPKIAWQ